MNLKRYFSQKSLLEQFINSKIIKEPSPCIASTSVPLKVPTLDTKIEGPKIEPRNQFNYMDREYFVSKNIKPDSSVILGRYYEDLVIKKLQSFNLNIDTERPFGKDKGIDFTGQIQDLKFIGQCKFYKKSTVSCKVLREFSATCSRFKSFGFIVGSTKLSTDALKEFKTDENAMIFGKFIPYSTIALVFAGDEGFMESLIMNEKAKEVLSDVLSIQTGYNHFLTSTIGKTIREEMLVIK